MHLVELNSILEITTLWVMRHGTRLAMSGMKQGETSTKYTSTWKLTLNTATIMENNYEQEAKEHLTFLMWADKVMEEIYQEEVNQELHNYETI